MHNPCALQTPYGVLTQTEEDMNRILTAICLALATLALTSCGDEGNTCAELQQWYAENPYDSNSDIALDYQLKC